MTRQRVYSGVTPEQLDQSNPTYASHWRSGADRQTAAAPPTAPSGSHHATCCRGSWTTQTKVIPPRLVHMFTLLYLMQSGYKCEPWIGGVRTLPLTVQREKAQIVKRTAADGQDEWKPLAPSSISHVVVGNHAKWTVSEPPSVWANQESM